MLRHALHIVTCCLILISAACSPKHKAEGGESGLRVMSYNVRYTGERETDGENHWDWRRAASINMVREERPAVMGVQEALAPQLQFLDENLPEYGYVGVGRDDGKSAGEHMAIFYLKEAVELEDWGTFWLSQTPDQVSMGWDAVCYRTCTWALMRDKATGKPFAMLNTHLDHRGEEAREQSIVLIVNRIKELIPEGTPLLLTGDFNSTTDSEIYAPLKAVMKDAREEAAESDRRGTFNGWGKASSVIDHIFCRGVEVDRFKVLCDKNYGAPYISDHYPVVADVRF
ncbi:MAG: endonuclease/exonuclease/phosphatase family protein [Alistipes sp.]|nr:endonuclease/exonuclease/phosphatase family protein [Alistipes sp.]